MSNSEEKTLAGSVGYLAAQVDTGADVFCEIRSLRDVIVAQGLAQELLAVPPDTYFVTARSADGMTFAAESPVTVKAGEQSSVRLLASGRTASAHRPSPTMPTTRIASRVRETLQQEGLVEDDDGERSSSAEARAIPREASLRATLKALPDPRYASTASARSLRRRWGRSTEGSEQIRVVYNQPKMVELEAVPRGARPRRYRIPVPVDRTGHTTLVVTRRHTFQLGDGVEERAEFGEQEGYIDREAGGSGRFVCEVDLVFEDPHLQSFWQLITDAAFEEAWARSEAMIQDLVLAGTDWMRDKRASPVGATLGAYVLLRSNRLEHVGPWSANLAHLFPSDADALIIRAEVLSRLGEHGDAARLLAGLADAGCPWMRSGVQYAWQLANTYVAALDQEPLHSINASTIEIIKALHPELRRLNGNTDQRRVNTVIYLPTEMVPVRRDDP